MRRWSSEGRRPMNWAWFWCAWEAAARDAVPFEGCFSVEGREPWWSLTGSSVVQRSIYSISNKEFMMRNGYFVGHARVAY